MLKFSDIISATDKEPIKNILEKSEFFYPFEIQIVMDLMDETIKDGSKRSGYYWIKLEEDEKLMGFANFGPNPSSLHSWDLYWIAIDTEHQNRQLGSKLLLKTEEMVNELGGKILWIETSGRPLYQPTAAFYERKGYTLQATLPHFYSPGDSKLIFSKTL